MPENPSVHMGARRFHHEHGGVVCARHCRICGEEFYGPLGEAAKRVATEALARHREGHTRDQIVRVYVLGEPWWKVMRDA